MATPMSADQLLVQLRTWGVRVVQRDGWRTHNRNHKGAWGGVNGSMVHHTASGDNDGIVQLCYNGRSDLPGPLCHGVIRKDGTVHLVGWGRTNHAGPGDERVLAAVIDERSTLPNPTSETVDGNARFYGWECVNWGNGTDPWPEAQLDAMARVQAAVCEHHGWSANSVIGHREWTDQKIDPRGVSMDELRGRVNHLLHSGPKGSNMSLSNAEYDEIARRVVDRMLVAPGVWGQDLVPAVEPPYNNDDFDTNKTWTPRYALHAAVEAARRAAAKVEEVRALLAGSGSPTEEQLTKAAQAGALAALGVLAERLKA